LTCSEAGRQRHAHFDRKLGDDAAYRRFHFKIV
jgi:hypothetical protein